VKDNLYVFKGPANGVLIIQAGLDKVYVAANFFNVFSMAGGEVIDHANAHACGIQAGGDVRTYEARPSRYQGCPGQFHR
jgi:hypothetical protein